MLGVFMIPELAVRLSDLHVHPVRVQLILDARKLRDIEAGTRTVGRIRSIVALRPQSVDRERVVLPEK